MPRWRSERGTGRAGTMGFDIGRAKRPVSGEVIIVDDARSLYPKAMARPGLRRKDRWAFMGVRVVNSTQACCTPGRPSSTTNCASS